MVDFSIRKNPLPIRSRNPCRFWCRMGTGPNCASITTALLYPLYEQYCLLINIFQLFNNTINKYFNTINLLIWYRIRHFFFFLLLCSKMNIITKTIQGEKNVLMKHLWKLLLEFMHLFPNRQICYEGENILCSGNRNKTYESIIAG